MTKRLLLVFMVLSGIGCGARPMPPLAAQTMRDCALYGAFRTFYSDNGDNYSVTCVWIREAKDDQKVP